MPLYAYKCFVCGRTEERVVCIADRNAQVCECGARLEQSYRLKQPVVQVPKGFQTSKEMVMGPPGSRARDEFEADIRAGKTIPAGKGSRWI